MFANHERETHAQQNTIKTTIMASKRSGSSGHPVQRQSTERDWSLPEQDQQSSDRRLSIASLLAPHPPASRTTPGSVDPLMLLATAASLLPSIPIVRNSQKGMEEPLAISKQQQTAQNETSHPRRSSRLRQSCPSEPEPRELTGYGHARWTSEEDDYLMRQRYAKVPFHVIARNLPGRSPATSRNRFNKLDLYPAGVKYVGPLDVFGCIPFPRPDRVPEPEWEQKERDDLIHYRNINSGWAEISDRLPNRSPASCLLHWIEVIEPAIGEALRKDLGASRNIL
jgi:hypothetical protein